MSINTPDPTRDRTGAAVRPADCTLLSVNIHPQVANALRAYMEKHDVTATEAIRRMISIGTFIDAELQSGRRIFAADRPSRRGNVTDRTTYREIKFE